ncbi:FeoA family protein [Faecalibacter rhinopitheci]|uniref:Ferrous iron transport protein A n=1 Tax=Faecalibacter rhinopitheci TaxID=2779678 RepID=A0A8J7G7W9_9FLAO|nr:FeoA family protein [Faecalibacter rhinopitheci]MBF0596870.1 ferrous iron transport protein A [Faecalibacter rhinopitheci]MBQ0148084.1 ferrous iron transport protein A [Candidatus Onthonaster equi]
MSKTLKDLKIGDFAIISGFVTEDVPAKLYDMGFIPGTEFQVKNKAPFGGPICISIINNKSLLALRKSEASQILIEKI